MILNSKIILTISLLTFSIFGLVLFASYVGEEVYAEAEAVSGRWDPRLEISVGTTNAIRPALAAAPNGKTVLVTYTDDNQNNPYYSFSTNNGKAGSWTFHRSIYPTSTTPSSQTAVTFDKNNKAHVVWIENTGLAYANSSNLSTGFSTPKLFTDPLVDPGSDVLNPQVITFNNHVHIIGIAKAVEPYVFHVHSADGGATWKAAQYVTNFLPKVDRPDVAVDTAGNLHVVYNGQKYLPPATLLDSVSYALGSFNGSVVSWTLTNHIDITTKMPATTDYNVIEPSIVYTNGRLEVSVTQQYKPANPNLRHEARQFVYHIHCNGSCLTAANWNAQQVSGQVLYIDNEPYNLTSDIGKLGNCSFTVFDGKISTTQNDREQIFSSSSCNGWGSGRSEMTINDESRSIQPAIATQNNWWMYVVYEEFESSTVNNHKIYFMRNIPGVYLPMIRK